MVQPSNLLDETGIEQALEQEAVVRLEVGPSLSGNRLDKALASLMPEHSRGRLQQWIESGHVSLNQALCTRVRQVVAAGDELVVAVQASQQALAFEPEDVDFEVVAESGQWLVVNKRAGLVVHPGAGNWQGTLLNGLLYRYPDLAHVARAGIVHRLDKDTTGLMVVAKTETAQTHLVRQLQDRSVKRHYQALVGGWLDTREITIDRPIGRDPRVPVRMSVLATGASKPAVTIVRRLSNGKLDGHPVCQIRCQLQTGRTHQIRVHLASLGHALVGDGLYGGKSLTGVARQMLHAQQLAFVDPATGESVAFECAIPDDMQQAWDAVVPDVGGVSR